MMLTGKEFDALIQNDRFWDPLGYFIAFAIAAALVGPLTWQTLTMVAVWWCAGWIALTIFRRYPIGRRAG